MCAVNTVEWREVRWMRTRIKPEKKLMFASNSAIKTDVQTLSSSESTRRRPRSTGSSAYPVRNQDDSQVHPGHGMSGLSSWVRRVRAPASETPAAIRSDALLALGLDAPDPPNAVPRSGPCMPQSSHSSSSWSSWGYPFALRLSTPDPPAFSFNSWRRIRGFAALGGNALSGNSSPTSPSSATE